jgi:hypothetical protein
MKCNTWCCSNTTDSGEFVGDFCAPCYKAITTGVGTPVVIAWFEQLRARYKAMENSLSDIQESIDKARRI